MGLAENSKLAAERHPGFRTERTYELVVELSPILLWCCKDLRTLLAVLSTLGMLALIVLFYKLVPEPANRQGESNHNPSDQHAWLRTFRTELNKRNDMTDARVRDEVALVLAHSRETRTIFDEEFGHPVTYARSLAGQSSVKPYRLMLYAFFMVSVGIYWFYSALTAGDGSVWWRVPLGLVVLIILALEAKASWATYRSSRQASAPDA